MSVIEVEEEGGNWAEWIARLEAGSILLFRHTPFRIPDTHREALLHAGQADGKFHKNISYRPLSGQLSGLGKAVEGEQEQVRAALRGYSESVIALLIRVLAPYRAGWRTDYASFRSIEEEGRNLPWKKRNDLLHTDAFPTRPTHGGLILRVFTNIHQAQDRVWITGDPFAGLAAEWAGEAGLQRYAAGSSIPRAGLRLLSAVGLPVPNRSRYDEFMLHFHDFLKSNRAYQEGAAKYRSAFPPNSTWMAFTDIVPHAVMSGRYALEQTMIIARDTLLQPECAPASILERICGRPLTH